MIILLWNYPSIYVWTQSHYLYFIGTWVYTMTRTYYINNRQLFMLDGNVKKKYRNLLISHIYRTIGTCLHSYLALVAIYLLQKETVSFLLIMSLFNHFIVNYLYYFETLNHRLILVKHVPHMIDTIIIIGCIEHSHGGYWYLKSLLCLINMGMFFIDAYNSPELVYKLLLWTETYLICTIIS